MRANVNTNMAQVERPAKFSHDELVSGSSECLRGGDENSERAAGCRCPSGDTEQRGCPPV